MDWIKIYRGVNQIGGVVTEIRKGNHRILIDFGAVLPGADNAEAADDELVKQVFSDRDVKTDAVFFTHYHGDHVGLKNRIPDDIPLFAGRTAIEIMKLIATGVDFVKIKNGKENEIEMPVINRIKPYWRSGAYKDFSGIKVMPLVCDHSALDAYMFVIELNSKRILYTGDFRAHGIPGHSTFEKMITQKVGKTDILVTEGTMVSRIAESAHNPIRTEAQLRQKAMEIFSSHSENVVLVSSTNLDSVMSFYNAVPEGMAFVCDPYQARIMKIAIEARHKHFPKDYRYRENINVICPDDNEYCMRDLKAFKVPGTDRHPFMMARWELINKKGFAMLARPDRNPAVRPGKFKSLLNEMNDPFIVYSMWGGYLKGGKAEDPAVVSFMDGHMGAGHMEQLHTSGHAYVEDLARLMDMTDPDTIIPMHTENVEDFVRINAFGKFISRIEKKNAGEVYEI